MLYNTSKADFDIIHVLVYTLPRMNLYLSGTLYEFSFLGKKILIRVRVYMFN